MQLSSLSTDILVLHISPLLSQSDIRSLAKCNRFLSAILGPLRFQQCRVHHFGGYFRMFLSRATIRTIRELLLNGSDTEHDDVFRCGDLNGVRFATILTPIRPRQRFVFGRWSRRLERLRDCAQEGEEPISSLANLSIGSIQKVRSLKLDVSIPVGIDRMLDMARNLERIRFMPAPERDDTGYTNYLNQLNNLMALLHDNEQLPALKIVHVAPSYVSERHHKVPHQQMLLNVWAAALSHGGWRLQSHIPTSEFDMAYPAAWKWWWGTKGVGFTITLKEARQFVSLCHAQNIYPQLDRYVRGPIHIQTGGGTAKAGTLPGTAIHGVWIHHGRTTNVTAALRLVTEHTKVLALCLDSYWGSTGCLTPDAQPYERVEGLMFDGPVADHVAAPFRYCENLCVAFIKGIQLASWTGLVNLSLPAVALQHEPVNGVPLRAPCGLHLGGYNMEVIEGLTALKALSISQWLSCSECDLHPDASFENGLRRIPPNVEYVSISGSIGYHGEEIPQWIEQYARDLCSIVRANCRDVLVICDELYLQKLSTDPYILSI